jgi:DNA repair photolyase
MVQVLHLFGYLPNMLELSMTTCTQGCDYCYAKTWKRETIPLEKVVNNILYLETKREGLLPFLIRKRSPITISNRTDVMCAPDWRERLSAIKKMGFPIYLETKLNKDYKDLAQILDKKIDTIYQTITGYNNLHEEYNLLSAEEKLEAARWLNEQGFSHILAVNPYLPDKVTVDEIKKMIDYVKPYGVVMRDYHTTSRSVHKHLFMKEWKEPETRPAREAVRAYCREKKILHDIDQFVWLVKPYRELNLRIDENEKMFGGNHFVFEDFLIHISEIVDSENNGCNVSFSYFLKFYAKQIEFFKDCIFKKSDYSMTAGKSNFQWGKDRFDIIYFLQGIWNQRFGSYLHKYIDYFDEFGNKIYCRPPDGLVGHTDYNF